MFRTQYDSDISIYSPEGRLYQIEYAMQAVAQGSTALGLKSKTHAVVVTLMRSSDELSSHQRKIFKVDGHMGIAISGLTADARVLLKFMRNETLHHKFVYGSDLPTGEVVSSLAMKSQRNTQRWGRRPYGVGLLVIGYDGDKTHLYQTSPSGNCFSYYAQAIGSRSQSARTYLEKNFKEFPELGLEELVLHGVKALKESSGKETLTKLNVGIAVVGKEQKFEILKPNKVQNYLDQILQTEGEIEIENENENEKDEAAETLELKLD
ncbi:proteasome subunit alpha type-1 [Anaeramoeba flamelloides]|uniref:Proteasome subunit alpha type n=1 Tax=Anaeramoeba flamelloides TaxID=1746091 RepID=A0ABQ8XKN1_9EUKA|nr:proteasome subunit alpha type-1 [Anaeramoeba flamelloides]